MKMVYFYINIKSLILQKLARIKFVDFQINKGKQMKKKEFQFL